MNEDAKPTDWKLLYRAALLEADPEIAANLMVKAEQAIVERALALHREASDNHAAELRSLAYSANFLAELRRVEVDPAKDGPRNLKA